MARAFLFVLDSLGIGNAPDAEAYGDLGSDTFGHIAEYCAAGAADGAGLRSGPLNIPNLAGLGLVHAHFLSTGYHPAGLVAPEKTFGAWAAASEVSLGKDTPSGHWEIAGTPVDFAWGYFPVEGDAFSPDLVDAICKAADLPGILGNCHASGTDIINRFGEEHISSGKPICYTSSDSVFQIAAHETHFGLERLLSLCQIVRKLLDSQNIGRVIARPFVGETSENFERTGNRRDFSVLPPDKTLLDRLVSEGRKVHAVGKIADIFAHQGISRLTKANGNMALFDASLKAMDEAGDGDLVFTNFVDFDMNFGHRRDVAGYAAAIEAFDRRLPEVARKLKPHDLVILTADHGCDPTWRGTDHTRERVPVLAFGPTIAPVCHEIRDTYADIGESVARHLSIPGWQTWQEFPLTQHLKKVELHCHIEGAASPLLVLGQARKYGAPTESFITGDSYIWQDFTTFLHAYDSAAALFKTEDDFALLAETYLTELAEAGTIYSEIFVSPDHGIASGLGAEAYINGLGEGMARAKAKTGIESRMVVIGVRHLGAEHVVAAARFAVARPHPLITGFNMAGDERMGRVADFVKAFDIARDGGLGITIHAGELCGAFSVRDALDLVRPDRIGHGVRAVEDPALVDRLADSDVVLEVCPGSNIALKLFDSFRNHPLRSFYDRKIRVTLNSDDPPFFHTSLAREYEIAQSEMGFSDAELNIMTQTALDAAFLDEPTRARLKAMV